MQFVDYTDYDININFDVLASSAFIVIVWHINFAK